MGGEEATAHLRDHRFSARHVVRRQLDRPDADDGAAEEVRASRRRTALTTAILLMTATACGTGSADPVDADVLEVRRTAEPTVLELAIDTCNAELEIRVSESVDDVAIAVRELAPDPSSRDDCLDLETIELDAPLGERTIVGADGRPIRPFPYPRPVGVSDDTERGSIEFCGEGERVSPPDPTWSDEQVSRYYEDVDLGFMAVDPYRSDPNWRGLSYRRDGDRIVNVLHFATITPELEAEIADAAGDLRLAVEPPDFTDAELDAARSRLDQRVSGTSDDDIVGLGGGPGTDVPGRVAVYLVDPANAADLAERIGLDPPHGPFCIWPTPVVEIPDGG